MAVRAGQKSSNDGWFIEDREGKRKRRRRREIERSRKRDRKWLVAPIGAS